MQNNNLPVILVTGSNGQLGNVFQYLSRFYNDFKFIFTNKENLDICSYEQLNVFFSVNKIDYIINCAALTNFEQAENNPALAFAINGDGPGNLAKIASHYNAVLLHISTDYVFVGNIPLPRREDDPTEPISIYGLSKLKGEKEILNNTDKAFIFRTSWLYSHFSINFFNKIIQLAKEKNELKIVYDQIGSPTYALDLGGIMLDIIRLKEKNENVTPGIYHYANEGAISRYDLAIAMINLSGLDCKIYPIESKDFLNADKRPNYSVLNKDKIKKELNIEIPYWLDSLKQFYSAFLASSD